MSSGFLVYTGAGAHSGTPSSVLRDIVIIAGKLEDIGYTCRTGDAPECDKAFRTGVKDSRNLEVHERGSGTKDSIDLAMKLHPNREIATRYSRWLGRNPMQVAGKDLDKPSRFLVCWTPYGEVIGGTGLTIRVAMYFKVPVLNLFTWTREAVIETAWRVANDPSHVIEMASIVEEAARR